MDGMLLKAVGILLFLLSLRGAARREANEFYYIVLGRSNTKQDMYVTILGVLQVLGTLLIIFSPGSKLINVGLALALWLVVGPLGGRVLVRYFASKDAE